MFDDARAIYRKALDEIEAAGLTKRERLIETPQGAVIRTQASGARSEPASVEGWDGSPGPGPQGRSVLNFCANNYLGLSSHPVVLEAARAALDRWGYGLSSVRFICGTQSIHKELESAISRFLGTEDTILYSSCFDANGGLFETLLGEEDVVISDALNHASIIDGIRLSKADRLRYANGDMAELEQHLIATRSTRRLRLIATDGVFSMDGCYAKLDRICELAERYGAMVMVDDSHASGFVGKTGRGTPELCGVVGRVDVITSTLGKALGGASGGFTSGRKEIVDLLRQRSRPYLFSNSLAPPICAASLAVLGMLEKSTERRDTLEANTRRFRSAMTALGFRIPESTHPIAPVMIGDARKATAMADALLAEGIYVIGFSFPVVPRDQARIRVQLSAAHEPAQIDQAVRAFAKVGRSMGVIE